MEQVLLVLNRFFTKIHEYIALICGTLFFLYMLNIVADVTGRYIFSYPILGTIEIGENVLAIAVFMSLAAVQTKKENIRVTLLQDHVPTRIGACLNVLALICGLLFIGFVAWQSLILAKRSLGINEVGINIAIPLYIGKFAFFVGCVLLCMQLAYDLCHEIYNGLTAHPPVDKEKES
jgi:TRAP-type C4-dicarboxylate transport system permease small subunit